MQFSQCVSRRVAGRGVVTAGGIFLTAAETSHHHQSCWKMLQPQVEVPWRRCLGTGKEHTVTCSGAWSTETLALSWLLSSVLLTNNSWSELSPLCSVVTTTLTVVLMELYAPISLTHPPQPLLPNSPPQF